MGERMPGSTKEIAYSNSDIENIIIDLLKTHGKMRTGEIQTKVQEHNMSCPDGPVRFLNILRQKGAIHGEVSVSAKGWIWWV
jgi:hypothetical protein